MVSPLNRDRVGTFICLVLSCGCADPFTSFSPGVSSRAGCMGGRRDLSLGRGLISM